MNGNGKIEIQTKLVQGKQGIKIKVQDTGPGIPEEIMPKLFDPFFTTKEKGTGLGLAISYGIIKRHQGEIEVETESEQGSSFIISLPVLKSEAELSGNIKVKK